MLETLHEKKREQHEPPECPMARSFYKNSARDKSALKWKMSCKILALAYFPPDGVSSALTGLTAEFGMGSGVALSLETLGTLHSTSTVRRSGACPVPSASGGLVRGGPFA